MKGYMKDTVQSLRLLAIGYNVKEIAEVVLSDYRFPLWSGSSKPHKHHYGKGGLLQHVFEVVELSLLNNQVLKSYYKDADPASLYLAALFHDAGKMWDYEPLDNEYKEWTSNEHKDQIHHITRSALLWEETAKRCNFPNRDSVLHAILAHHGFKEFGSPVEPQTILAWILHTADLLSARTDDCYRR